MLPSLAGSSWTREQRSTLLQQLCAPSLQRAQPCTTQSSMCWWTNRSVYVKNGLVFTSFVVFIAIVLILLFIRLCFFSLSSVTACSALLEWAAWWRMRPQCLPARQKSPLCPKHRRLAPRKKCLKWRDIFLRLDIFLFTASFIWNNPWYGLSEVQGCMNVLACDQLQEQTHALHFLIFYPKDVGKCRSCCICRANSKSPQIIGRWINTCMWMLTLTPLAVRGVVVCVSAVLYRHPWKNWFKCPSFFLPSHISGEHFILRVQNEQLCTMSNSIFVTCWVGHEL